MHRQTRVEGRTFDAVKDDLSTQFIAACVPAQIKVKIEQTTRVAAWSVVQDRLLLVQVPCHRCTSVFAEQHPRYSSYRHFGTARRCGRAIKTIVASGSRPSPETPLNQRAVERTLCRDQSAHAGGWITRGEVLICTTDE